MVGWAQVCALFGIVPLMFCAKMGQCLLAVVCLVVGIVGVGAHSKTFYSSYIDTLVQAINIVANIFLVICLSIVLKVYASCVGIFRIVWLVTLISASTSYASFREALRVDFVPNDVTLVVFGVSVALFGGLAIVARRRGTQRDVRSVFVELLLVGGALSLRYNDDLDRLSQMWRMGWILWYASSYSAVVVACCILATPAHSVDSIDLPTSVRMHRATEIGGSST